MNERIDAILTEIERDKSDGATSLALRGLDALELLAPLLPKDKDAAAASIVSLVRRIDSLRPSMTAIGNQALIAFSKARSLMYEGNEPGPALVSSIESEREALGRANTAVAHLAAQQLGQGGTVMTCSWSVTAMRSIVEMHPANVIIGEGHRLGDGLRAAKWLAARGMEVEVVPDASLPAKAGLARIAVVGADQVLIDGGLVNRASTFSIALAAAHFRVPFYVTCQRVKLGANARAQIEQSPVGFFGELPKGVTGEAPLFDVTPPELISGYITEAGLFSPGEAKEVGHAIGALRRDILGE